jgi:hypothetical protein
VYSSLSFVFVSFFLFCAHAVTFDKAALSQSPAKRSKTIDAQNSLLQENEDEDEGIKSTQGMTVCVVR